MKSLVISTCWIVVAYLTMAEFVEALPIADHASKMDYPKAGTVAKNVATSASVLAYVNSGMIITIPSTLSDQLRQDVLYSLLLSQLAANFKYSRTNQLDQWLQYYQSTLSKIAWVDSGSNFGHLSAPGDTFKLADLALREMTKQGSTAKVVDTFHHILDALHKLPDSNIVIQTLYKYIYDKTSHNTTVLFCSVNQSTPADDVIANMLLLSLEGVSDGTTTRSLFHPYRTKDVKTIKEMSGKYVLDEDVYASIRAGIQKKLGDKIKTDIRAITVPAI